MVGGRLEKQKRNGTCSSLGSGNGNGKKRKKITDYFCLLL